MTFIEACVSNSCLLNIKEPTKLGINNAVSVMLLTKGSGSLVYSKNIISSKNILIWHNQIEIIPENDMQAAITSIKGSIADDFMQDFAKPAYIIEAMFFLSLNNLLRQLAENSNKMCHMDCSALAYSLLCKTAQAIQKPQEAPFLVSMAVQEINEHFAEIYGIEELANSLQVTKSHLIRSFSAFMSVSPGKYLTLLRLENAKRLLQNSGFSLEIIAGLCGFSSANYLCKVFKKEVGQSPAAWKKQTSVLYHGKKTIMEEQVYL